jgi:hypothetical protein
MPGMQNIKTAIGKDDFLAALPQDFTKSLYIFTCN